LAVLELAAVFLISLFSDLLSCEWQSARERGQLARIAALSAVIEAMSWFPIFVAVFTQDVNLVVSGICGAVVGGVWGASRERRRGTKYRHLRKSDGDFVPIGKFEFANRELIPLGSPRRDEYVPIGNVPDRGTNVPNRGTK
jgi:hypothetical protein